MEAKDKYLNHKAQIQSELALLKDKLKEHQKGLQKNPTNWGYVGDLSHVLELLKEINSFIK